MRDFRSVARGSVYGLGTAMAFSISPVLVRLGMAEGFPPEVAVTVGLGAAFLSYALLLVCIDRRALDLRRIPRTRPILWEAGAAAAIVTGTWLRYVAMDTVPLAIVSALGRTSLLVILIFARRAISIRVWIGGALIVAGTVLLSF